MRHRLVKGLICIIPFCYKSRTRMKFSAGVNATDGAQGDGAICWIELIALMYVATSESVSGMQLRTK